MRTVGLLNWLLSWNVHINDQRTTSNQECTEIKRSDSLVILKNALILCYKQKKRWWMLFTGKHQNLFSGMQYGSVWDYSICTVWTDENKTCLLSEFSSRLWLLWVFMISSSLESQRTTESAFSFVFIVCLFRGRSFTLVFLFI